jgi:DNA polymerase-3 subunit epsilon
MILFTDTETTGFYRSSLPPEHPSQPHIVQIAAILCDDDANDIMSFSAIIDPGVPIRDEVAKIHGITEAKARKFGMLLWQAMGLFSHLYRRADLVVAHNAQFDLNMLNVSWLRSDLAKPQDREIFCTINMPPTERMKAAGFNKPKAPKLSECIKHFFGEELDGAHDAMVDVIACKRIYFHMKGLSNGKEDEARRA